MKSNTKKHLEEMPISLKKDIFPKIRDSLKELGVRGKEMPNLGSLIEDVLSKEELSIADKIDAIIDLVYDIELSTAKGIMQLAKTVAEDKNISAERAVQQIVIAMTSMTTGWAILSVNHTSRMRGEKEISLDVEHLPDEEQKSWAEKIKNFKTKIEGSSNE